MSIKRGLPRGPGPWVPSSLSFPGASSQEDILPRTGPSNLDLACKAALQQILRPSNYPVINPWMMSASTAMKRDMVQLADTVKQAGEKAQMPSPAMQVVQNPSGRMRSASAIPMTADRAQADLQRNRSGSDQRSIAVQEERNYFQRYSRIPSTDSVADFHRLSHAPVHMEESTKVLSDQARRRLMQWQLQGPEQNHHISAEIMRSLRSISSAVDRLPTYVDAQRTRQPGTQGLKESLYDYSKTTSHVGTRILKEVPVLKRTPHSSSAPALHRPLISPEDVDAIGRPGGYVVKLMDNTPLQTIKNKTRALQSQVSISGASCDFITTSKAMAMDLKR